MGRRIQGQLLCFDFLVLLVHTRWQGKEGWSYPTKDATTKWLPNNPFHPNEACLGGILPVPPSTKLRDQHGNVVRTSEMNEAEARTLVEMFTNPGETVYDGSAGTCTIVTACLRLGRKVAVTDPDKAAIDLGITRCKRFLNWYVARDLIPLGEKPLPEPPQEVLL